MRNIIICFSLILFFIITTSCKTVDVYNEQQVPTVVDDYETRNIPKVVDVYEMVKKPYWESYTEIKKVPFTVIEQKEKLVTLPPLISENKLVIAFTKFAGADNPEVERVATSLMLGFKKVKEQSFDKKIDITFIPRVQLVRTLTESELKNLGPVVEKKLRDTYNVNIICTGTVLGSNNKNRLAVEILNLNTGQVLSEEFVGYSWEEVGEMVARAFFGTRNDFRLVTSEVTKYRDTEETKSRLVYREVREKVGTKTEYEQKQVKVGTKTVYRSQQVKVGTKTELDFNYFLYDCLAGGISFFLTGTVLNSVNPDLPAEQFGKSVLFGGVLGFYLMQTLQSNN